MDRTPISSNGQDGGAQQSIMPRRVLIADDEPHMRQLLELTLRTAGYEVISASNGQELIQLALQHTPHLIIADLMMPLMDGYEAIRQMRNDTRTAHIPMIILTARARSNDVVSGFETGADDYISKPFDISELLARVKSHLRRAERQPVTNPLSGLPSGKLLSQEIRRRLPRHTPLALLYADLDSFKAFNDVYGFSRGDRAILMVAGILRRVLADHGGPEDFLGHIGGDDFAVLTTPERIDPICLAIINGFDRAVSSLYNPDDWERGYLSGTDRYGILRRFKLMTISIGVVTNQQRSFADDEELARVAAEMKHFAKAQEGSSYAIDQRTNHASASVDQRNLRRRGVLLVSADGSLRSVLRSALLDRGYTVQELEQIDGLSEQCDLSDGPIVVLADAHLGQPLWSFCANWPPARVVPSLVVLAHDNDEVASARHTPYITCLQQPLPLSDVVACVDQLVNHAGRYADDAARIVGW